MTYTRTTLFLAASVSLLLEGPITTVNAFAPSVSLGTSFSRQPQAQRPNQKDLPMMLRMSKNSERANIERHLEEMMGDDWRLFRAKLVAQEQREQQGSNNDHYRSSHYHRSYLSNDHGQHVKPSNKHFQHHSSSSGQFGDFFSGAINSFFHKSDNSGNNRSNNMIDTTSSSTSRFSMSHPNHLQQRGGYPSHYQSRSRGIGGSIFDGDSIGATQDELMRMLYQQHNSLDNNNDVTMIEDPFVSRDELPCLLQAALGGPASLINKHRWAHSLSHIEQGCVLLANERLGGVFSKTVVLIVQHCEKNGSIGIVINRPMDGNLLQVASEQQTNLDLSLKLAFTNSPVTYGGPVLTEEFSLLHGFGEVEGSKKLCPGVFVGGSEELMNEVRINRFDPRKALFVQGHAAWVPGQLSRELAKGVWYTAAASADLVLRYAGNERSTVNAVYPNDLWADIMSCMGEPYATIAQRHSSEPPQYNKNDEGEANNSSNDNQASNNKLMP